MEIVLMLGMGLFLTIRLRGVQFRLFGKALRSLRGSREADRGKDGVSAFQAVCTALAGTLGTGNIAGVAGAIALGGPGAVFWMSAAALLGMATKYTEVALSVRYRRKNTQGEWIGGPMYYIEQGLGTRFRPLAKAFCIFGIMASLGVGNMAQVGALADSLCTAAASWSMKNHFFAIRCAVGALAAAAAYCILKGGLRRVAWAAERLIPWVSAVYVTGMVCVVVKNIAVLPEALRQIGECAFTPRAFGGGAAGIGMMQAARVGVSRGLFTHEAGMGSSPIAHAGAHAATPVRQGLLGIFEVFADTLVLCTLTALGILVSGCDIPYGQSAGAELTAQAMAAVFGLEAASTMISVCLGCFAFPPWWPGAFTDLGARSIWADEKGNVHTALCFLWRPEPVHCLICG